MITFCPEHPKWDQKSEIYTRKRVACENIRFSSLFARETSSATKSEEKRMFSQASKRDDEHPNPFRMPNSAPPPPAILKFP